VFARQPKGEYAMRRPMAVEAAAYGHGIGAVAAQTANDPRSAIVERAKSAQISEAWTLRHSISSDFVPACFSLAGYCGSGELLTLSVHRHRQQVGPSVLVPRRRHSNSLGKGDEFGMLPDAADGFDISP